MIEKIAQFFKSGQNCRQKFISKTILKVKNVYIKTVLKPLDTNNKPCFETAYLGENVKTIFKQKSSPKLSLGYFIFTKI
jgi:hypothetical protein